MSQISLIESALQTLPQAVGRVAQHYILEGLLWGVRAWRVLGKRDAARAFLGQVVESLENTTPTARRVEIAAQAAEEALALGRSDLAFATMQQAHTAALEVEDPWMQSETWRPLARGWHSLKAVEPLLAMARALGTWDDPWAQYHGWQALLFPALDLNAPTLVSELQRVVRSWEAPFLAQALAENFSLLAQPRAYGLVQALGFQSQALDDPFYRAMALSEGARLWYVHDEHQRAYQGVAQAQRSAGEIQDPTRRGEALARVGRAWAVVGRRREARKALDEAVDLAAHIGYMDDRTRVLHPALEGYQRLGFAQGLERVWKWTRPIGYPRFFGPLARRLAEAWQALNRPELARQILTEVLDRAETETHVWKQVILLQSVVKALPPDALLERATVLALGLAVPRYRAQALVLVARAWAHHGMAERLPALWRAACNLPVASARQSAVEGVYRAWLEAAPGVALAHLSPTLTHLAASHVRARVLFDAARAQLQASRASA